MLGHRMRSLRPFHKKAAALIIVIFLWSIVAIAFDQHDDVYSSVCPICHAKNLINGKQDAFVLHISLIPTHFCSVEKLFRVFTPITLPFKGRAPPATSQV